MELILPVFPFISLEPILFHFRLRTALPHTKRINRCFLHTDHVSCSCGRAAEAGGVCLQRKTHAHSTTGSSLRLVGFVDEHPFPLVTIIPAALSKTRKTMPVTVFFFVLVWVFFFFKPSQSKWKGIDK